MALFGTSRKKQLWDVINGMGTDPYPGTPPIHDPSEHPTDPTEVAQEYDPSGAASPPPQKRGFFGAGDVGRGIAGSIGDFLLQQAHMAPVYAPAMQQQREMDMRMQQYQQQRQDTMTDWKTQQQWERDHPKPVNNDTVADYEFYRKTLGEDAANTFLRNKADPPQYMQVKDPSTGEIRIIPVPKGAAAGQQGGGPAPGTIRNGYRFKGGNPNDPSAWEEAGGAGPAAAPSGFLRRR